MTNLGLSCHVGSAQRAIAAHTSSWVRAAKGLQTSQPERAAQHGTPACPQHANSGHARRFSVSQKKQLIGGCRRCSPPQVWATSSTSPVPASLAELCREPQLLPALMACLAGAPSASSSSGGNAQQAEQLAAARTALEVAAALLAEEALRDTLISVAGGEGAVRRLGEMASEVTGLAAWQGDAQVTTLVAAVRKAAAGEAICAMETDE